MVLLADNCQNPPAPVGDAAQRARDFDLAMGMLDVESMLAARPACIPVDYLRPTWWVNWTRTVVGGSWATDDEPVPLTPEYRAACAVAVRNWLDDTGADGVQIDTPFDVAPNYTAMNGVQLCAEIAQAIAPRFIIPNFGDYGTWSRKNLVLRDAAGALGHLSKWHYVQMFLDLRRADVLDRWRALRPVVADRLNAGKRLVLGLYDEGGLNAHLGAAIILSYQHERLYWNYTTAINPAPSLPSRAFNWNTTLEALR